jgi:hypothetical protein
MRKLLPLAIFFCLVVSAAETDSLRKGRIEFADLQFREAVISFFQGERKKDGSQFSRYKESFLDDPSRIEYGEFWSAPPTFHCFIIDREQMKYEYNYLAGNSGWKIHGSI